MNKVPEALLVGFYCRKYNSAWKCEESWAAFEIVRYASGVNGDLFEYGGRFKGNVQESLDILNFLEDLGREHFLCLFVTVRVKVIQERVNLISHFLGVCSLMKCKTST